MASGESENIAEVVAEVEEDDNVFNPWSKTGWINPADIKAEVEQNPKYFKHVKINASAAAKMLEHARRGVIKGRKRSGMPIEICGLLVGKIRAETFVVYDSLPLPVEGTEAQVVANDERSLTLPFKTQEFFEKKGYNFIGWYHSHPFDLARNPHWFMSGIDCQSQTMYQAFNNQAWVAIVIDPIKSMYRKTLELGSFFCYPPEYNPPENESCDGLVADLETIYDRWGHAYKRYYLLETDYFMSNHVLNTLAPIFDDWKNSFLPALERPETQGRHKVATLRTLSSTLESSEKGFKSNRKNLDTGMIESRRYNHKISAVECRCRAYAHIIKGLIFNADLGQDGTCTQAENFTTMEQ